MGRAVLHRSWQRAGVFALFAALFLSIPNPTLAWGRGGHRLIVNKAVETLPADVRSFFEANRALLSQHVTDPLDAIVKSPAERHNHFILLDKYGRFPFEALPRNYKAAVTKRRTFPLGWLDLSWAFPLAFSISEPSLISQISERFLLSLWLLEEF